MEALYQPDYGHAARWQHSARDYVRNEEGELAARALEECALDRWLLVGGISRAEHQAGLRLRADYVQAGLVASHAQSFARSGHSSRHGYWESAAERRSATAEAAYQRWHEALRNVGQGARRILTQVVCHDGAWPWPQRSQLRQALHLLALHYNI